MHINLRRLVTLVLLSLVVPLAIAIGLDFSFGWMPLVTIGATVIFIPLSTIIVVRATLSEFDTVLHAVVPPEPDPMSAALLNHPDLV